MLTPCLGYDNNRNMYRFSVGAEATQAEVQKLTGTSVLQWQNVGSIAAPVQGQCYFDSNSFTFGIVTSIVNADNGTASLIGAFYQPIQNSTTTQVPVPSNNLVQQSYQNTNNLFTSVDVASNSQCIFSLQQQNASLAFTCFNTTSSSSTSSVSGSWVASSVPSAVTASSSSINGLIHAGQRQGVESISTTDTPQVDGVATLAGTATLTPATTASAAGQGQAAATTSLSPTQICTDQCQSNGVLVATESHVLLLGWPSPLSAYLGNISDARSDASGASSTKFSLRPVSNSIQFGPGTAVSTGPDSFAYLTYGNSPVLQLFNISSTGSITQTGTLNNVTKGSSTVLGNMVLLPGPISTSNLSSSSGGSMLGKRAGSSQLIMSSLDTSNKMSMLSTDPMNPTQVASLDNGDSLPGVVVPTSSAQPTPAATSSNDSSPNVGAIAGGVVGGVVLVAICIGLLLFFRRRSRHRKYDKAELNSRGINEYNDYIDERPSQRSTEQNMLNSKNLPLISISDRTIVSSHNMSPLSPPSFSPVITRTASKTLLPDYTQHLLQEMNIAFTEYTGPDASALQKELKGGSTLFDNKYVLTGEAPVRLSAAYMLRNANKLPDKTEQVSIHLYREGALELQLAQVSFATKLHGPHIVNHIQSYTLPNSRRNGFAAVSITEICSPTKSLSRLIHPAPGDHSLADTSDRYFQRLTIKSLLQAVQQLHSQQVCHLNLSVNAFFHQGGDVTEWKLGKLEDCKVVDDYLADSDVVETTAPEVLNGQETNATTDSNIWSLGVVIYELVTGKPLFKTADAARQFAKAGNKLSLDDVDNEKARMLLSQMLVLEPMQRQDIGDLIRIWEDEQRQADYDDDDDLDSIDG